jgi:hypothetical protein
VRCSVSDHDITHREIYDRLVAVEAKVDRIDQNTHDVVVAFKAASGAFVVLEFFGKLAKPVLCLMAITGAVTVAWQNWKAH